MGKKPVAKKRSLPKRGSTGVSPKRGPQNSKGGNAMSTTDPAQIQNAAGIPPQGATFAGVSPGGVAVYSGTLPGDIDAAPAAKELLETAPDTGADVNADYIYKQCSALYGNAQLPDFAISEGGNNINVKALTFVSGSAQGGYGAFHFPGTQEDFDRIVVDSLDASGSYSPGSGLGNALAPIKARKHLFPMFRGGHDLLGVIHEGDLRLKGVKADTLREALGIAGQSITALKTVIETRDPSRAPKRGVAHHGYGAVKESDDVPQLTRKLILANQSLLGLTDAALAASGGRQYLSTALFCAELVESFETLTGKGNAGQTDGEAVSRVVAFKLAPEIALIPGFSGVVTQQWWKDGKPDYVSADNSQNDQSTDGNGSGVMFLLFLTDYLGVALDEILLRMPDSQGNGAPLGNTYVNILKAHPELAQVAGQDGKAAFQKMVALLQQNAVNPDGSLNLPANGNPFPGMPGAKQGGLFSQGGTVTNGGTVTSNGAVATDAQAALQLETQVEQQVAALKAMLQQIQGDASGNPPASMAREKEREELMEGLADGAFAYKPPLVGSATNKLAQQVAPFRAPQYDQSLQNEFGHVYNELPGTGPNTNRLQVITGTNQTPFAVQITGTLTKTPNAEKDGDLHISFQPDDPRFPTNQNPAEPPLEIEIIYAGPVTQPDAQGAEAGYKNPFDTSQLVAGTRIQAAGPLIYDRAHGVVDASGNVMYGLEIHPLVGLTVLTTGSGPSTGGTTGTTGGTTGTTGQLSSDLDSALAQAGTLSQTLQNLTSLIQKMKGEAPAKLKRK